MNIVTASSLENKLFEIFYDQLTVICTTNAEHMLIIIKRQKGMSETKGFLIAFIRMIVSPGFMKIMRFAD